jgi:hypothetical protein
MLALHGGDGEGREMIMLVLEPGNLEKLKQGQPIHKWLNEFIPGLDRKVELILAYTPDMEWVVKKIGKSRDMETVATAIEESLSRPEVLVRGRTAEELKRVF